MSTENVETAPDQGSSKDEDFLREVYWCVLGREIRPPTLVSYLDALAGDMSREQILDGVLRSEEASLNGAWAADLWPQMPDPDFVKLAFQLITGRLLGTDQRAHLVAELAHGQSRLTLVEHLIASHVARDGPPRAKPLLPEMSTAEFVEYAYSITLRRPADADGLTFHSDRLAQGLDRGRLLVELLTSSEAKRCDMRHGLSDAEFLTGVYQELLGVEPDVAGFEHQLRALQTRARRSDVLLSIAKASGARRAQATPPKPAPAGNARDVDEVSLAYVLKAACAAADAEEIAGALEKRDFTKHRPGSVAQYEDPLIRLWTT